MTPGEGLDDGVTVGSGGLGVALVQDAAVPVEVQLCEGQSQVAVSAVPVATQESQELHLGVAHYCLISRLLLARRLR